MGDSLLNIVLLGGAFMVLFIAFQTTSILLPSVLEGVQREAANGTAFHGSGYISQAIMYGALTLFNLFAPAVVSIFGPAVAMVCAATTYFLYVLACISPMTWSFYLVSILIGFGGALLWTAQGVYLTINSDDSTISRNSGVFWALLQISLLPGNIYVYLSLKTETIDRSTRYSLFAILSVISAVGLLLFLIIAWRSYKERRRDGYISIAKVERTALAGIRETLKNAARLLRTTHVRLLLIPFFYLGLSPTFFVVVYGTSIGHYMKYGDTRKRLLGLHGALVGVGEILGGGLFGFISKPKSASQRSFVVLLSFMSHAIFYYSVFINFPSDASAHETSRLPYVDFSKNTSQILTFIGSFLAGLGDSGLNTQIMSLLGSRYKHDAASVFSIFRLAQGLGAGIAFGYAGSFSIAWQLAILVLLIFFSALASIFVLFHDSSTKLSTFVTVQENEQDYLSYQNSSVYFNG